MWSEKRSKMGIQDIVWYMWWGHTVDLTPCVSIQSFYNTKSVAWIKLSLDSHICINIYILNYNVALLLMRVCKWWTLLLEGFK
jgi:hypothetical protein